MAQAFQPFTFQTNAFEVGTPLATLTADAGSYSIAGNGTSLEIGGKITALAGSYSVTGQTARLFRAYTLTGNAGSYSLTGQNVNFSVGKTLIASAGTYTLSGQVANLIQTHVEPFAPGFYPVTGQSARLFKSYTLNASYTSGETVFQDGTFQSDFVQSFSNQNDMRLLGKPAYSHYLKAGTQIYVVV